MKKRASAPKFAEVIYSTVFSTDDDSYQGLATTKEEAVENGLSADDGVWVATYQLVKSEKLRLRTTVEAV